jgi:DNA-binding MarR family transcriptional regulator
VSLSEAADSQMRLVDLAQQMLWSKSRLGHHLDRMAARGLVQRRRHPDNSRAAIIALTDLGRSTIERAAPHHVESVRRHLIDLLTEEQLDTLGDIAETVLDHLTAVQNGSPNPDPEPAT